MCGRSIWNIYNTQSFQLSHVHAFLSRCDIENWLWWVAGGECRLISSGWVVEGAILEHQPQQFGNSEWADARCVLAEIVAMCQLVGTTVWWCIRRESEKCIRREKIQVESGNDERDDGTTWIWEQRRSCYIVIFAQPSTKDTFIAPYACKAGLFECYKHVLCSAKEHILSIYFQI